MTIVDLDLQFKWGVNEKYLSNEKTNSALILIRDNHLSQLADEPDAGTDQTGSVKYPLLYIRNTGILDTTTTVKFRLSVDDVEYIVTPDVSRGLTTSSKVIGMAIADKLNEVKATTGVLTSIIRADPPSETSITILSLVAIKLKKIDTVITLDVLQVPNDVEITLGDSTTEFSAYSNYPRTLMIKTIYDASADVEITRELGYGDLPKTVKAPQLSWLENLKTKNKLFNDRNFLY
jgi:hypothetical protein